MESNNLIGAKTLLSPNMYDTLTHFSQFVRHMSAFEVTEEILSDYQERIMVAYLTARTTDEPQVVMGEGDFFMVITPRGGVVWSLAHKHYNLISEDENRVLKAKDQLTAGSITLDSFRNMVAESKEKLLAESDHLPEMNAILRYGPEVKHYPFFKEIKELPQGKLSYVRVLVVNRVIEDRVILEVSDDSDLVIRRVDNSILYLIPQDQIIRIFKLKGKYLLMVGSVSGTSQFIIDIEKSPDSEGTI